MSTKSTYLNRDDVEFLRSGFGITLVGCDSSGKSVSNLNINTLEITTHKNTTQSSNKKPEPPAPTQDSKH